MIAKVGTVVAAREGQSRRTWGWNKETQASVGSAVKTDSQGPEEPMVKVAPATVLLV